MEPTFLIWSIEHEAWWRAGWLGYTIDLADAGHYSAAEARGILERANVVRTNECAIPLGYVETDRTIARALKQIREDTSSASLLAEDGDRLDAIEAARGESALVWRLLHQYYGDFDRANRTPRPYLYIHLGILIGILSREEVH